MKSKMILLLVAVFSILLIAGCTSKSVDKKEGAEETVETPGVTDTTIKLGILNDFSGGASYMGLGGEDAYLAYAEYINDNGGINGRKVEFVAEDNQFTPAGNVNGSKKLITLDKVFAIPYSFGTAPTVAIKDYINKEGVPVLGLGEGTEFFNPASDYLFGVGTPYSSQAAIATHYIAETLTKGEKVKLGFMGQDDSFGKDPLKGIEIALKSYENLDLAFQAFHKRDVVDVSDQVTQLKSSGAEYLLISASVERTGIIVKELAKQNVDLKGIFSVSLASIDNRIFEIAGNDYIDRYYGIQSFYTWDQMDQEPVKKVVEILKQQGKEDVIEKRNNFFWYSWNNMALFGEAMKLAGKDLTREGVVKALESLKDAKTLATLPGITYGPGRRISGDSAFVVKTKLNNEGKVEWESISDSIKVPEEILKELGF
jgi:branched-chain amino acid transport system substrate-binding protein